jgi:hypothetical protein
MKLQKVKELVEAGKKMQVKVTGDCIDGEMVVNIQDEQHRDYIRAAFHLQEIQRTQLIDPMRQWVG